MLLKKFSFNFNEKEYSFDLTTFGWDIFFKKGFGIKGMIDTFRPNVIKVENDGSTTIGDRVITSGVTRLKSYDRPVANFTRDNGTENGDTRDFPIAMYDELNSIRKTVMKNLSVSGTLYLELETDKTVFLLRNVGGKIYLEVNNVDEVDTVYWAKKEEFIQSEEDDTLIVNKNSDIKTEKLVASTNTIIWDLGITEDSKGILEVDYYTYQDIVLPPPMPTDVIEVRKAYRIIVHVLDGGKHTSLTVIQLN